ncbi:NTP transferase domain-containing protein [Rappaport israeli]|uniref:NTP transferase domain-containing protein n=1 Tax=Rappaport israeli TaxID=1839807 RepID=UPI000AC8AEAF|nr:NTP transferase domain-containing protein [Rappaport israeli]
MAGSILALVLAAGKGSRMRSAKAKVLQLVGGRTMIEHVLATVAQVGVARQAVVFGHEGEALQKAVAALPFSVSWVAQEAQLGTGHAVLQALDLIGQYDLTLVLLGDVPLVGVKTLQRLCASAVESGFAVLTAKVVEPFGYGRIVRDERGAVVAIVEEKEADEAQRAIDEVNTGIMAISRACLQAYLPQLSADNAQGEFYLTDLIALARADGQEVSAVRASSQEEVLGVNDRAQLAQAEAVYRKRQAQALLDAGATLVDPLRVDIQGSVSVGRDVVIEANVVFKGKVVLGDGVVVESGVC